MKRIFVKSVNWVGDAVLTTPALRVLRRTFPEAHITLMARPWVADVFEANPDIDRVWVVDETASIRRFREIAARIRNERFDLGFSFPNSFGAALLMAVGQIARRVGYKRDGRGFLLTDPIPVTPEILKVHQVEYYLNLLRDFCDMEMQLRELVVVPAAGADEHVTRVLEQKGLLEALEAGAPLVGLCPGATFGTAKRWYPDRFAAVADHLAKKWGAQVVIVGSKGERDVGEQIAARAKSNMAVLSGEIPLRGLIALCSRLRLFVTNDSGAMHVAAGRGVPIVAVFGPTDWLTTAPYHPHAVVVRHDKSCERAPCLLRHCPEDHRCMDCITVEEVAEMIDRQMELWECPGENPPDRKVPAS